MGKTKTFTASTTPTNVSAVTVCTEIVVGEDDSVAGWPTVDLKFRKPASTDTALQKAAGKTYAFKSHPRVPFQPGDVVGTVETASGSTTVFQDET